MVTGLDDLPPDIKRAFEELTMVEEMLISPILAIQSIYRLPGGAISTRGFVANFKQDIQPISKLLPRLPKELPLLILKKKDQKNQTHHFSVNKKRVEMCLKYLCKNNKQYINHNISIDQIALDSLPDDNIPSDLLEVEDNNIPNIDNYILDQGPEILEQINQNEQPFQMDDYNGFIENNSDEPLQVDLIKNAINWPPADPNPINEYTFDSICSLLFPKLFPNGKGDPTKAARKIEVTESLAIQHLIKVVTKSAITGNYYYP